MITSVTVQPTINRAGWWVMVGIDGKEPAPINNGNAYIDMSEVQAEASRWVTRMLLGHEL